MNSAKQKHGWGSFFKYFETLNTTHAYKMIPQTRFFRKCLNILFRENKVVMLWVKLCISLWNRWKIAPTFYLEWVGPQMTQNTCDISFVHLVYLAQILADFHNPWTTRK
jgi:hypothetical protein